MGIAVLVLWILWVAFVMLHIAKPALIPLRWRVASFYVPMLATVLYAFSLNGFLGWMAVGATFLSAWDSYDRREEMS